MNSFLKSRDINLRFNSILCLIILSFYYSESFAHSGRTNSDGCHNNRKTGGYHCHNSGYKRKPDVEYKKLGIDDNYKSKSSISQTQENHYSNHELKEDSTDIYKARTHKKASQTNASSYSFKNKVKEKCVIKPVMSDQDYYNCGATPPK